jgi:type 1 glutamine amidotransferase
MNRWLAIPLIILAVTFAFAPDTLAQDKKKIVFIAGRRSHGFGAHDHKAGCHLLAKCLRESGLPVEPVVVENGWPTDESVLDGAAAIVIYADGGGGHPALKHLDKLNALVEKGVGVGCIHYGVEPGTEKDKPSGRPEFLKFIGGYFETFYSVNPFWTANYKQFPRHPVTQGVRPFSTNDEWYYNMRFRENMEGVTPVLTDTPPESTRGKPDANDAHGGNAAVRARKGQPEHTTWVASRKTSDGKEQRGFGTTGGHVHWNWAQDDWRKLVLNMIVWTAQVEVPADGVASKTPTMDDMMANHDEEPARNFDRAKIEKMIADLNKPGAAAPKAN